jgi:hypothetical protein
MQKISHRVPECDAAAILLAQQGCRPPALRTPASAELGLEIAMIDDRQQIASMRIAAFAKAVDGVLASSTTSDILTKLATILKEQCSGGQHLRDLLHGFSHAVHSGLAGRARSHLHPNGFAKIALLESPCSNWRLRLHVWPERSGDAHIHDHRWDFASFVVFGQLSVSNYMVATTGTRRQVTRLSDADVNGHKSGTVLSPQRLRLVSSYDLPAGATHSLSYTEPHTVFNVTHQPAATLVVTGPPHRDHSHVYGARRQADPPQSLTLTEQEAYIRDVHDRLNPSAGE